MKAFAFSILALTTGSTLAQDYQSISTFSYNHYNSKIGFDNLYSKIRQNSYSLNSTYYLDKKTTLGPLDQFDYINTTSNIFGGYSHNSAKFNSSFPNSINYNNSVNTYRLGGEYFFNNKILIGGSYQYISGSAKNNYDVSLGYLISDDLLLKVSALKGRELLKASTLDRHVDTDYLFSAQYKHQLAGKDYLGFTYSTDNKFDNQSISAKYFSELGQDRYLTAGTSYSKNKDYKNILAANVGYYFNQATSIYASYANDDTYSVGAKYYLNKQYAIDIGYEDKKLKKAHYDRKHYTINFTAQF